MYNNFLSKKSKKAISALLASALVITAAPINAEAATTKTLGVGKSFTVTAASAKSKITGLSAAEKKIVSVTRKNSKSKVYTIKAKTAGKVTFKIGAKTVKVNAGATKIFRNGSSKVTVTAGKYTNLDVRTAYGKGDTLTFTSSNSKVASIVKGKTTAKVKYNKSNSITKNTKALKAVKAGKATITIKSKNTGKSYKLYVTVKAATPKATATPVVTTNAPATPVVTETAPATTTAAAVTETPVATATAPAVTASAPAVTSTPVPTTGATITNTPAPTSGAAVTETPAPTTGAVITSTPEATTGVAVTSGPATTETPAPAPVTAAAVSAAAVNTKIIAVTFNRDLTADEQAEVLKADNYSVVKDKVTQNVKLAFNDAKTLYIKTSSDGKFSAGTYTVKLTGEIAYTEEVKVEDVKVTSLTIDSSTVSSGSAVKVSLLDQYNDDITIDKDAFTVTAINKTSSKSVTASIDKDGVKVTLGDSKVDDEIILTLVHKASALSATKTLKVVSADYVNKLTFGDIVLPSTDKRLTTATQNLKIMYTATTFYNESAKLDGFGTGKEYTVISSNNDIVDPNNIDTGVTTDTKQYYINIKKFGKKGSVTLVFVNNKTGETVNITLDVQEAAGVATEVSIGAAEVTVAQGSKTYVALTAKDNYQDVIAAENLALTVASTNDKVKATLVSDKTDANYGKLKIEVPAGAAKENDVIVNTITAGNASPVILTIKVAKAAEAKTISATASESRLLVGGSAEITVSAVDQYNGEFDFSKVSGYKIEASVKDTTNAILTPTVNGNKVTVAADKNKSGTEVITVKLMKADTSVTGSYKLVDSVELTFAVEANDTTNFDYAVKDIPVLAATGAALITNVTKEKINLSYAKAITVTATKKSDSSVVVNVPASSIKNVTTSSDKVTIYKDAKGVYYVAGNNANATADATATLKINVLTSAGYETLEKVVTVSKEQPKVEKVILAEKAIEAATSAAVKAIDTVTVDKATTVSQSGVVVSLAAINQYGVYEPVKAAEVESVDVIGSEKVEGVTSGSITVSGNGNEIVLTVNKDVKVTDNNATIKVAILLKNGANTIVTIKITENK